MRFILIITCFLLSLGTSFSLSDQAQISILSCGAGEKAYSSFGHSGIRVYDPIKKIDYVYNYGIFNFKTSYFIAKFLGGSLDYRLKKTNGSDFIFYYRQKKRTIYEQVLNLDSKQINDLYLALEENAKPENQYYRYDFYNANCTTKIVDQLESLLANELVYQPQSHQKNTFRQSIHQVCSDKPWFAFGLDIIIGRTGDKLPSTLVEHMNLPPKFFDELKNCYIVQDKHTMVPFVSKYITHYQATATDYANAFHPKTVLWALFILALYITFSNAIGLARLFDWLLFTSLGLAGVLSGLIWLFSGHTAFDLHVNLLWINPLHLIIGFYILLNPSHQLIKKYFFNYNLLFFGMLVYIFFSPTEFNPNIMPLFLTALMRSLGRSGKANFKFSLFRSM